MRKMKNKIIISLLLLSSLVLASGGSIYTRFGIGDILLYNSAREMGLGGTGIAHGKHDYIGTLNPAAWSKIELTRLSAGVNFKGYDLSDNSQSAFYTETDFSGMMVAIPISNDYGITLVGGLLPYSNINYNVAYEQSSTDLGNYKTDYTGSGGLSKAFVGLSYTLPFDLSIGTTLEYFSGKTDYLSRLEFEDQINFTNSEYSLSLKNHGIGFTFGILSPDFSKYIDLESLSEIRIGATYHITNKIKSDSIAAFRNSRGFEEYSNSAFNREIPSRLGVGLSLQWKEKYTFMFDFVNQNFSEFTEDGNLSPFLRDLQRYSLGFEFRHGSGRFSSTWEQMIWRAGLSYEQSQYIVNGKGIDEVAAYAGFSYPIGFDNSIDFGFKYGIRGTTENNLIKENIFAAFITINFGDLWFIRPER